MIYGERVRHARELRGFTQTELAERLGINQSTIAYIENRRLSPSEDLLNAIALQTGFPPSFFRQEPSGEFPLGSLLFRSRAAMTSREEIKARRYAQTVYALAEKLMSRVKPIALRLPNLVDTPPATAARITRAALGLSPDTPISHLINVVERSGVLVLALPIVLTDIDAFSLWAGPGWAGAGRAGAGSQRPVIVISNGKPGDRLRFSVAHELGHLVMHQAVKGDLSEIEREANEFAGELLLPDSAMRQEIIPPVTLSSIAALKPRWRVSMQALIMRASELDIISERQKRYLFQQISMRGWRTREPSNLDIPTEKPRALRQLAELSYGSPINYEELASEACLPSQFVRQCMSVHAPAAGSPPDDLKEPPAQNRLVQFPDKWKR